MTIFTSTTDEMLAARFDPEPWKDDFGGRYASISDVPDRYSAIFDPRPGYRAPQNPILVALREGTEWDDLPMRTRVRDQLDVLLNEPYMFDATPAQIEHARKVLTRLANVYKEV